MIARNKPLEKESIGQIRLAEILGDLGLLCIEGVSGQSLQILYIELLVIRIILLILYSYIWIGIYRREEYAHVQCVKNLLSTAAIESNAGLPSASNLPWYRAIRGAES